MSPRKLTEDDKQEILQLYRNSQATTSTLADRYEVSSSTISRFLKNKLSSTEYEDLIQQKRLARTPRGEKATAKKEKVSKNKKSSSKAKSVSTKTEESTQIPLAVVDEDKNETTIAENSVSVAETTVQSQPSFKRRRRRRSSASLDSKPELLETATSEIQPEAEEIMETAIKPEPLEATEESKPTLAIADNKVKETDSAKTSRSSSLILKSDKPDTTSLRNDLDDEEDEDDDDNEVDLITLKEMLGEDLEDINDEEDEDDWEDEEDEAVSYSRRANDFDDVEILPLSQATFPRTCYLVIDRSAELIVKPLADFADLGEIPQEEVREKTLPVFDNHNIAKRFSHRRERVIKVPDGRMLQKTSRHLQDKGITRLLIDGQIYSLSS